MKKSIILIFVLSIAAAAQSGGPSVITKSVISGGGGRSAGGTYTLDGTFGQPISGKTSGSNFTLGSGFWNGGGKCDDNNPPAF